LLKTGRGTRPRMPSRQPACPARSKNSGGVHLRSPAVSYGGETRKMFLLRAGQAGCREGTRVAMCKLSEK